MPGPAAVMGDRVTGMCVGHLMPGAFGAPQPSPPLPFAAPLTVGLAPTVLIGGKPAAVVGSNGVNVPPHVGLHPSDPHLVPAMQKGTVVSGVPTVLIEGKPAATTGSTCTMCFGLPGTLVGSAAAVLIGMGS
jgi:uncharacterized Zn-binding protein involved in type VI secretion